MTGTLGEDRETSPQYTVPGLGHKELPPGPPDRHAAVFAFRPVGWCFLQRCSQKYCATWRRTMRWREDRGARVWEYEWIALADWAAVGLVLWRASIQEAGL
jgi:hypothetical protein